ncbi:putative UPF0496 protein 2 isoform X2 [Brachypodium distachyon]|nr:putative UPF0496 protein 2 isoform X2 [Brachypodium distachyon]KQK21466.1 hypothetical protein BRADI_1g60930v3 [Brachypodium distachyon]|eukprot:XP_014752074.1 putative UPF0496 protein 2 isoform X2 [Brachypodium distachyon]
MEGSNESSSPAPAPPPRRSPVDVDEEYGRAFKSKSFVDLWSHAHRKLSHTGSSSLKLSSKTSSSFKDLRQLIGSDDDDEAATGQSSSCSYTVLDDFVLVPSPETLVARVRRRSRRRRGLRCHGRHRAEALLLEFFDVTREACEACSALLAAIGTARRHHLTLRRLLLRGLDGNTAAKDALARHVGRENPLAPGSIPAFHEAHARCAPLAKRLAAARRRLRRLARAGRVARCAVAATIVGASAAAVVAAVVLAAHAVVGVGAAAAAFGACCRPAARWFAAKKVIGGGDRERAGAREAAVDTAARGAYIVGRDLDTVSRMVRRAHDELEHGRDMARIAVRGHAERPLLREVAREEEECGEDLRGQLEELEEHACLCLTTINRSRRMVAQEMTRGSPSTETTAGTTSQD